MPPAIYAAWWYESESCSGLRRDFRSINWYLVEDDGTPFGLFPCAAGRCAGAYIPPRSIYLAAQFLRSRDAVQHETLHALGVHEHVLPFGVCAPVYIPPPPTERQCVEF